MQKLVLYLNERLGQSARVELLEHWELPEKTQETGAEKRAADIKTEEKECWDTGIGSEAFVAYLTRQHLVSQTLTMKEQERSEVSVPGLSVSGNYFQMSDECQLSSKCGTGRRQTAVDGIYRRGTERGPDGIFTVVCLDAVRDKEGTVCQFYGMQWDDGIV